MWPLLAEENTGRNWGKKGSLGYSEEIITFVGIKQGDKTSTFLFIILAYERIRSKILFFWCCHETSKLNNKTNDHCIPNVDFVIQTPFHLKQRNTQRSLFSILQQQ